jgi:large subunit ribosomal protein L30
MDKKIKMKKIIVKQTRSKIGRPSKQKKTLIALGLGKINKEVELVSTPQVIGMVNKVKHLIEVKEI